MKNFFKICLVLLIAGKVYSQNNLCVKGHCTNTVDPVTNSRSTSSTGSSTLSAESSGPHFISGNPIYGTLIVKIPEDTSEYIFSVKNVLGQIVYSGPIKSGIREIDISSQPKGIYFVELRHDDEKRVEKVVFQ